MKTLILETSSEKSILVLADGPKSIAFLPLIGGPELSKKLALEVSLLLEKYNFYPEKIAVGQGPGSFTGIRVGAALAQALAFGWRIPLVGICSLSAFSAPGHTVLIDARMGGLYALLPGEAPQLIPLSQAAKALQTAPLYASPHPSQIQKRISLPGTWLETSPDPALLAHLAHNSHSPVKLEYLSTP